MAKNIPTFAVVGRTNKGKSSLVATLTENEQIAIAPTPRTTSFSQDFTFTVDGEELFRIYDTPGFEEAPAILEWLKAKPVAAHERQERVREFYRTFKDSGQYRYECELLGPILEGAAILYVADASHPFRPNFESEFEILQWTGQPSIALLNHIGEGHYEGEWKRALEQYFRAVRVFNTHTSWIKDRIALIDELVFLSTHMAEPLRKATAAMRRQLDRRLKLSAEIVTKLIHESLKYEIKLNADHSESDEELSKKFFAGLSQLEEDARKKIARTFGFHDLSVVELGDLPRGYGGDLFSHETWEIAGLDRTTLMAIGTASGAVTGGSIDAMVGGASFLVGTGIGTILGGLGSVYLAYSDPEVAGFKISKKKKTVGPYSNPNLPWILIDRQAAFVSAILKRTHAQKQELTFTAHAGPSAQLEKQDQFLIGSYFLRMRNGIFPTKAAESLEHKLEELFLKLKS